MLGRALGWLPAGGVATPRAVPMEQKRWRSTPAATPLDGHSIGMDQNMARLDPEVEAVVRSIHANGTKATIFVTGGASQVISL